MSSLIEILYPSINARKKTKIIKRGRGRPRKHKSVEGTYFHKEPSSSGHKLISGQKRIQMRAMFSALEQTCARMSLNDKIKKIALSFGFQYSQVYQLVVE